MIYKVTNSDKFLNTIHLDRQSFEFGFNETKELELSSVEANHIRVKYGRKGITCDIKVPLVNDIQDLNDRVESKQLNIIEELKKENLPTDQEILDRFGPEDFTEKEAQDIIETGDFITVSEEEMEGEPGEGTIIEGFVLPVENQIELTPIPENNIFEVVEIDSSDTVNQSNNTENLINDFTKTAEKLTKEIKGKKVTANKSKKTTKGK